MTTMSRRPGVGEIPLLAGGFICDMNSDELLKFTQVALPVNEFTIANAASGSGPVLSATGDNTDIDVTINTKGAGALLCRADEDLTSVFGRAAFHSSVSDFAYLSHYDQRTSTTKYAVRIENTGACVINSFGTLTFRVTNVGGAAITSTAFNPNSASGLTLGTSGLPWGATYCGAITASPDTDSTHIFGRCRVDSRVADAMYIAHYDYTATSQYAVRMDSTGLTVINAISGQLLYFSNNGNTRFSVSNTSLEGVLANSPSLLYEASSDTNPTVCPDKAQTAAGLGGSGGTANLIAASVSAVIAGTDGYARVSPTEKGTTGDPAGASGRVYINTFDNKIAMYADGAWRSLATW